MQPSEQRPIAWQPITPRGVAAFAGASWRRLAVVELMVAVLAAGTVLWFLHAAWVPAMKAAIQALPESGEVRAGYLNWPTESPRALAGNRFLSFAVDLDHEGHARGPSHVQVEFGRAQVKFFSLFGFVEHRYGTGRTFPFNRPELEPWWGAWSPAVLAAVTVTMILALFFTWSVLATFYFLPLWLVGFFINRDLTVAGSWKLSSAALMPGALLLSAAIFFYGLGMLDLTRLLVAAVLHLALGWVYLFWSVVKVPWHPAVLASRGNPFASQSPATGCASVKDSS
jgi:hypothetical protein